MLEGGRRFIGLQEKKGKLRYQVKVRNPQKIGERRTRPASSPGSSRAGRPSRSPRSQDLEKASEGGNSGGIFGAQNLERGLPKLSSLRSVIIPKVTEESCQDKGTISTGTSVFRVDTIRCEIAGTDVWWGIQRTRALENCGRLLVSTLISQTRNPESATEPGLAARFGTDSPACPHLAGPEALRLVQWVDGRGWPKGKWQDPCPLHLRPFPGLFRGPPF